MEADKTSPLAQGRETRLRRQQRLGPQGTKSATESRKKGETIPWLIKGWVAVSNKHSSHMPGTRVRCKVVELNKAGTHYECGVKLSEGTNQNFTHYTRSERLGQHEEEGQSLFGQGGGNDPENPAACHRV